MSEKLQKVLARAGLGSRREIERWITEGRVQVEQNPAKLGDRVEGDERILLDGRPVSLKAIQPQPIRVIAYHKGIGSVCSRQDEEGRPSVFDDFPKLRPGRWILVGRLDITTTGLLLATNDGELANRLMHPKFEVKREYAVRIYGEVTDSMLQTLQTGVELDDGPARFDSIKIQGGEARNLWFTVVLHEGRNREVRRLWESQGVQVNRLVRDRFGPIHLPRRLKPGQYEELTPAQVAQLCQLVQLSPVQGGADKQTPGKAKSRTDTKTKTNVKAATRTKLKSKTESRVKSVTGRSSGRRKKRAPSRG